MSSGVRQNERMLVNARMYAVTPECKAAWRIVLDWLLGRAGVKARHEDHDPPKLLSDLWARDDLACVMMCGLPFIATADLARIREGFLAVHEEPSLDGARNTLLLDRFVVPDPGVYRMQRERAAEVDRLGAVW